MACGVLTYPVQRRKVKGQMRGIDSDLRNCRPSCDARFPRVRNTGIRAGLLGWTCPGEVSAYPASRICTSTGYGSFLRFVKKRSITDDVYQKSRPFGAVLPHRLCTVDPVIEALAQVLDANVEVVPSHFTPNT